MTDVCLFQLPTTRPSTTSLRYVCLIGINYCYYLYIFNYQFTLLLSFFVSNTFPILLLVRGKIHQLHRVQAPPARRVVALLLLRL